MSLAYMRSKRFDFGPDDVGVMMMVLGLVSAVAQGCWPGQLQRNGATQTVIKGGLLATALGFGLMLLANTYLTILLATAFFALVRCPANPGADIADISTRHYPARALPWD
jgi:MFS transporter, DHA1 family, multidrug resistance protein